MKAAIIGAGPAGSFLAYSLARRNIETTIFHRGDEREKPCGGGITFRALKEFPIIREIEEKANRVHRARILSPSDRETELHLQEPILIFSRIELDSSIREHAFNAGAQCVQARVTNIDHTNQGWKIGTDRGSHDGFDLIVGADGASGITRKRLSDPFHRNELTQTIGFLIHDATDDRITLKFYEDLQGYAWSFPRLKTINVGIGTPLGMKDPKELLERVEHFIERYLPKVRNQEKERFSALIPFTSPDEEKLKSIAGENWALIGDSSGITDPITREGIYYALSTASLIDEAIKDGRPLDYPALVQKAFEQDLSWAYRNMNRFFKKEFIDACVEACNKSSEISSVVAELFAGTLPYRDLLPRLFAIAFKVDMSILGNLISHLRD